MEIKDTTVDKIWNYLATTQIWGNVEPLMHEISDQIAEAQQLKMEEVRPMPKTEEVKPDGGR